MSAIGGKADMLIAPTLALQRVCMSGKKHTQWRRDSQRRPRERGAGQCVTDQTSASSPRIAALGQYVSQTGLVASRLRSTAHAS